MPPQIFSKRKKMGNNFTLELYHLQKLKLGLMRQMEYAFQNGKYNI